MFTIRQVLFFFFFFFLLIITWSSLLTGIRWSVCILKCQRISWVLFTRMDSGLRVYHLIVWSNYNLLNNSQRIIFPIQLYLVLYSFCSTLLHFLFTWLFIPIDTSLSLAILLFFISFRLNIIIIALLCTAINKDHYHYYNYYFSYFLQIFSHQFFTVII